MIPYTYMHALIDLQDERLDANIIDLAYDSFTFRIAPRNTLEIKKIELHILKQSPLCITQFEYSLEEVKEYYQIYRVISNDALFQDSMRKVMKDYNHYIELKNEHTWHELSHELVNYPLEDHFYDTFERQYQVWMDQVADTKWYELFSQIEEYGICISLEEIDSYLTLPFSCFLNQYYTQRLLSTHPIQNRKVDLLYLGSQYCFHLLPSLQQFIKVINKAHQEGLKVALMTPPVKESELEQVIGLCKLADEVIINDYGLLHITKHTSLGVLLNKYTKDPRMNYVHYLNDKNDLNNDFYLHYLHMDYYYYEASHSMQMVNQSGLFFPYSTTNTATFCTTYALYHYGNRSYQHKINHCDHCCLKHTILYPEHLNMVGKYNSLLAFNRTILFDHKELEKYIQAKRMVLNL